MIADAFAWVMQGREAGKRYPLAGPLGGGSVGARAIVRIAFGGKRRGPVKGWADYPAAAGACSMIHIK